VVAGWKLTAHFAAAGQRLMGPDGVVSRAFNVNFSGEMVTLVYF